MFNSSIASLFIFSGLLTVWWAQSHKMAATGAGASQNMAVIADFSHTGKMRGIPPLEAEI